MWLVVIAWPGPAPLWLLFVLAFALEHGRTGVDDRVRPRPHVQPEPPAQHRDGHRERRRLPRRPARDPLHRHRHGRAGRGHARHLHRSRRSASRSSRRCRCGRSARRSSSGSASAPACTSASTSRARVAATAGGDRSRVATVTRHARARVGPRPDAQDARRRGLAPPERHEVRHVAVSRRRRSDDRRSETRPFGCGSSVPVTIADRYRVILSIRSGSDGRGSAVREARLPCVRAVSAVEQRRAGRRP